MPVVKGALTFSYHCIYNVAHKGIKYLFECLLLLIGVVRGPQTDTHDQVHCQVHCGHERNTLGNLFQYFILGMKDLNIFNP